MCKNINRKIKQDQPPDNFPFHFRVDNFFLVDSRQNWVNTLTIAKNETPSVHHTVAKGTARKQNSMDFIFIKKAKTCFHGSLM
jgi:hypothetical protein